MLVHICARASTVSWVTSWVTLGGLPLVPLLLLLVLLRGRPRVAHLWGAHVALRGRGLRRLLGPLSGGARYSYRGHSLRYCVPVALRVHRLPFARRSFRLVGHRVLLWWWVLYAALRGGLRSRSIW